MIYLLKSVLFNIIKPLHSIVAPDWLVYEFLQAVKVKYVAVLSYFIITELNML